MKRLFALLIIAATPLFLSAQKKNFTFNELFGSGMPKVLNTLPKISGWKDDDNYIEVRTENGKQNSFLVNASTGKAVPYTPDTSVTVPEITDARNATASPDGKYVAFTRKDNNLYMRELASGKETQITKDGSEVILNGYASWVYFEEILGRRSQYKAFWWSPDSKSIAFMRFDDTQVPVFPIYVADGQHGYLEQQHYPKAGDKNPEVKIAVYAMDGGQTTWADFDASHDQYFGTPLWTPFNELLVPWMNREQDSLIVYRVDKSNGTKAATYAENQKAWVDLDDENRFTFLASQKAMIVGSDKDGWYNLYLHDMNGKLLNRITQGPFWNTSVLAVNEKSGTVYFSARHENSTRVDVYKVSLKGGNVTRLSFGEYTHDDVQASPSGKYFITRYSNLSTPPALALVNNNGKVVRTIASSANANTTTYALPVTRIVKVKSTDGEFDLPMAISLPADFDSTKKYPVWISIYGGPSSLAVNDRWMPVGGFDQLWAQEGLIRVAMDNRSSGHFGKKGMEHIFKQMGKWEIEDYMACANWLKQQPWVDGKKIGITGGSFGGYLTLMALTYGADVFTHGISNFPVTDWKLYDSHYTERFMNTPSNNADGYRVTSPMSYIDRYKGKLRIVHGTTDDNVHMQNTLQFVNEMEDKRKNFEMMLYPNQRHGIRGQKTMHHLLETAQFIYENMLNKKMPEGFGF